MTSPGTIQIKHKDGVYAFDSSDGADDEFGINNRNVLSWMGTMLEKFLTLPTTAFNKYLRQSVPQPENEKGDDKQDVYQYSKVWCKGRLP